MALWYWRPPCLLKTVIVNLVAPPDEAIRGVLWQSTGPWLVLRQATGMKAGEPPADLAGEVVIERANVAFVQVLP